MPVASATTDDPDPDHRSSPPQKASNFLWKNLFTEKSSSVTPSSSPSYLADGTPVVLAPSSVILKATEAWTGHLLCHFLGEPPSPAKIFADLNPIWGKKGAITVRRFTEGTCLIFVPSTSSRRWILEAGLWSSGNVTFTVTEWTASSSLVPAKLTSAPTILTLRDVPPQLWSQRGVETIAGGVAKLIPNTRASLPISSLGTAKIRAIVPLGPVLPSAVVVQDSQGDTVRVAVEYGRLPVLCSSCKIFGHSSLRCPVRREKGTKAIEHDSSTPNPPLPVSDESSLSQPQASSTHLETSSVQVYGGDTNASQNPNSLIGPQKPNLPSIITQAKEPTHSIQPKPTTTSSPSDPAQGTTQSSSPSIPLADSDNFMAEDLAATNTDSKNNHTLDHGEQNLDSASHLTSQILAGITTALTSPRPSTTINSHINFPTPSTTSISPITTDSPPSEGAITVPFSFPPLANHSLEDCGNWVSPALPTDSLPTASPTDSRVRKEVVKEKRRQQSTIYSSLRCTSERHKFKPIGVVEKRKRKVNQQCLPDEEQIQDAFQEMKNDKAETCLYELIAAHKLMQKLNSDTKENSPQPKT